MRHVRRLSVSSQWRAAVLPLCAVLALGCHGEVGPTGQSSTTPLCNAGDPTHVIAEQRIGLVTSTQLLNMVKLISTEEAQSIVDNQVFAVTTDVIARFPPPAAEQFRSIPDSTVLSYFSSLAQHVGNYVRDHFAAVTKCTTPGTDECAIAYLNSLAVKAYRRQLTAEEKDRFTGTAGLYNTLRSQLVNGYQVTTTVEEATGNAVYGLFMTPQLLWRWELGAGVASTSPAGVYLTDAELASNLSFYLTDEPPDDMLLAAAQAGNLRANLAAHVDRIIATPASRAWLTKVMSMYFLLNQLPGTTVDATKFPIVAGGAVYADLEEESRLFLNDVMWNGKVSDLLTSPKAFLNTNLATMIYDVPPPPGATATNFVETTLPADKRAGMLTSAAFITTRARADGVGVVPRGLGVKSLFLCFDTPPPPDAIAATVEAQKGMLETMTAQQQVATRGAVPLCASCHLSFDAYGLVLDWYDVVGKYRTIDHVDKPIDGTTKLPDEIGGQTVTTAVELAEVLSKGDLFVNCMSRQFINYALQGSAVELPLPGKQPGCAVAAVANTVRKSGKQSFTDLTRAIATSPAFTTRRQVQ
jgi:hypothetical protein